MKQFAVMILGAAFAGAGVQAQEPDDVMLTARVEEPQYFNGGRRYLFSASNQSYLSDLAEMIARRVTKKDVEAPGIKSQVVAKVYNVKPDDAPRNGTVILPDLAARCVLVSGKARYDLTTMFEKPTAYVRCESFGDDRFLENNQNADHARGERAPVLSPR